MISGQTAWKVAGKMGKLASDHQIVCITHLPQSAAFADHQIRIRKEAEGRRTVTHLQVLTPEERVEEIMRMTTGAHVSKSAETNARELLAEAEAFKRKARAAARKRKG